MAKRSKVFNPFALEECLGNAFHVINLLLISAYGLFLYYGISSDKRDPSSPSVLDPLWLETGFCEPDRDMLYWTTHDLSCYTMMALGLFGLVFLSFNRRNRHHENHKDGEYAYQTMQAAENLVFRALLGALGHVAGHALIAHAIRNGFYPPGHRTPLEDFRGDPLWRILLKIGPAYPLFWMPLVRTYMHRASRGRVALVALLCESGSFLLPMKFGFAYTQSCLFAGLSIDQLFRPSREKGFAYALWRHDCDP